MHPFRISKSTALAFVPVVGLSAIAYSLIGPPGPSHPQLGPGASISTAAIPVTATERRLAPVILAQAQAQAPQKASSFSPEQRKELEALIKEYLITNPEIMVEVQQAFEAKQDQLQAERLATSLKDNAADVFRSPNSPVSGNPKGDVTVVEFFDYNCGYCKRAFGDLTKLMDRDKNVKVVLKELPILNKGSEETARVALAAKLQGKYWEFHRAMLLAPGTATEASALKVAEKIPGLDVARLKRDMTAAEVTKEIEDTRKLAQSMGIQGTPFFLVGERIIPGAPDGLADKLVQTVADIRKAGGCKVC